MRLVYVSTTLGCVVAVWTLAAVGVDNDLLLPMPYAVARGAAALCASGELPMHLISSLQRIGVGMIFGVPLGTALGCAMGFSARLDAALNIYVRCFSSIPALALAPLSLIVFGASEGSRYFLLGYTCCLVLLLSTRQGVRTVPHIRLRIGLTLGLSRMAILRRIIVPSCCPAILSGIRTALGLGVMVIAAAEVVGADSGLGYLIMQARAQYNMADMLVGVIGLGAMSMLLDRLFLAFIDRFLPRWSLGKRL